MFTLLIIIVVLAVIFSLTDTEGKEENSTKKTKIIGSNLTLGDRVRLKNGLMYQLVERDSSGVFTGFGEGQKKRLYLENETFTLINGIYVQGDIVKSSYNTVNNTEGFFNKFAEAFKEDQQGNRLDSVKKPSTEISEPNYHLNVGESFATRVTGVTYEGRQSIISKMSSAEPITIRRDRFNKHDRNAIGIYNKYNQQIGWIPREIAAELAPKMDAGAQFSAKINKILGGNGYNYGLEILISNDGHNLRTQNLNQSNKSSFDNCSSSKVYSRFDDDDSAYKNPWYPYDSEESWMSDGGEYDS